jgi:hypothetical protein
MNDIKRTELHQEVVQTLVEANAFDFEVIGKVFSQFAGRAVLTGDDFVTIINKNVMWNCGNPGPVDRRIEGIAQLGQ